MRFHRGLELVRKSLRKKALRLIGRAEMKPKRKVSESEIVESLLADAPGELKERVRQAANEDQTAALLHDHWSQIIEALQSEQPSYESLQERVITNVMARLPHETPASLKTTANESAAGRFTLIARPLRPSWRLLAAAACVVVSTGYFAVSFFGLGFQIQAPSTAVDIRVAGNNGVSSDTQYVAFGWTGAETGTSSQPFSSLHRGIASVSSGGMLKIEAGSTGETAKIAKPLTIVAVGGSVRIGAK